VGAVIPELRADDGADRVEAQLLHALRSQRGLLAALLEGGGLRQLRCRDRP
jgi:hypothetical protein